MRHSNRWAAAGVGMLCLLPCAAPNAVAQDAQSLSPQIIASGTADETIRATTASFSIEITSLAGTAAAASAESARITGAVTNALQTARLSRNEIAQTQLTVAPRWDYDEATRKQKRSGYEATTMIQIETDHLDRLGAYMDAALSAGATAVSMITFSAKDSDEARRRALASAVSQARADAETIARAGGGTLGELLLLTTEPARGVEFAPLASVMARNVAGAERTNIIPSQIKVTATIVGHWRFDASGAPR